MEHDPPDAGFMVVDGLTGSNRKRVIQFEATHRIPFMYEGDFIVRDGGLLSYGPDLAEVGERQASLLDKILHGAIAGDLPFTTNTVPPCCERQNRKSARACNSSHDTRPSR